MPEDRVILVTGFEPFGAHTVNPSEGLAKAVDGRRVGDFGILGAVLPVHHTDAAQRLAVTLADTRPAAVVHLGLAGGRTSRVLLDAAARRDAEGARRGRHPGPRLEHCGYVSVQSDALLDAPCGAPAVPAAESWLRPFSAAPIDGRRLGTGAAQHGLSPHAPRGRDAATRHRSRKTVKRGPGATEPPTSFAPRVRSGVSKPPASFSGHPRSKPASRHPVQCRRCSSTSTTHCLTTPAA